VTWLSTHPTDPYPVARLDGGEVRLLFGMHANKRLSEVPDQYLRWLIGAGFIPEDLVDLMEAELTRRGNLTLPDLRERGEVRQFLRATDTSLEAIAHLGDHLRDLLADVEGAIAKVETKRGGALEDALRRALTGDDED
jgi:uncharacterized protein (DUF3820 family)